MTPQVKAFFDPRTYTVTYLAFDPAARRGVVIDPVLDYEARAGRTRTESADAVLAFIAAQGLTIDWILETHVHADHLTAAQVLHEKLGAPIAIGHHVATVQQTFAEIFNAGPDMARDGSQFDRLLDDGETFTVGGLTVAVLHTPGHTPACISYHIGDAVFVGDTLFMPDYGTARCDFPGGSARTLHRSIRRLLDLPPETRVFVGHDYGAPGRDFAWEASVAAQRAGNKHAHDGISEDDFVAMREARDAELDLPELILPAVQVNMRGGNFPPREENGVAYLKIPLNSL